MSGNVGELSEGNVQIGTHATLHVSNLWWRQEQWKCCGRMSDIECVHI